MITFGDGPAKDQCLRLVRAPCMLRVVFADDTGWDALDKEGDEPDLAEKVYCYLRVGAPTRLHLNAGPHSGIYSCAHYRFLEDQPPEELMRDTKAWVAWVMGYFHSRPLPSERGDWRFGRT